MSHVKPFCILTVVFLFLLLLQFGQPVLVSAKDPCDPNLNSSTSDPLGYRLREDRCEGRYIQEVASTILLVTSLTESFEDYDLLSGKELLIEWAALQTQTIRLRAQGLRPRLYYRMDTTLPSGSHPYQWPMDILAALNIPRRDIGVVGWTRQAIGQNEQEVYVPLRISQRNPPTPSQNYKVILMPGLELTEVYISLAPVQNDGQIGIFIRDGEALEYGYYPAGKGIEFEISDLRNPGVYYLEIGATLKRGGSATIELLFYYFG